MSPHTKTAVDLRAEGSVIEESKMPPLAAVAQQAMPRLVRGRAMDFRLNRWRLKVVG
jgi:hypothetical protein